MDRIHQPKHRTLSGVANSTNSSQSSLTDTQGEKDTRGVALAFAGVSRVRRPVTLALSKGETCASVADFSLAASLTADERGTHMSRFIEALDVFGQEPVDCASLTALARELIKKLRAEKARVKASFPFFLGKPSPVTQRTSLMEYQAAIEVVAGPGKQVEITVQLTVPIGTLCPCSKAISERGAHNQRGEIRLDLKPGKGFTLCNMVQLLESCASAPLYTLLKREDEKFVTEQAYDSPAFVEDVVRNCALKLKKEKSVELLSLEVENFESIHAHNAWSRL